MNNDEIMVNEQMAEEVMNDVAETSSMGSAGLLILIGSGLAVAGFVAGKKLMKMYNKRKAKKEQVDEIIDVSPNDVVDVSSSNENN